MADVVGVHHRHVFVGLGQQPLEAEVLRPGDPEVPLRADDLDAAADPIQNPAQKLRAQELGERLPAAIVDDQEVERLGAAAKAVERPADRRFRIVGGHEHGEGLRQSRTPWHLARQAETRQSFAKIRRKFRIKGAWPGFGASPILSQIPGRIGSGNARNSAFAHQRLIFVCKARGRRALTKWKSPKIPA